MVTFISDKSANVKMDRGETRRLLMSIEDLNPNYRLSGLSQSGLSVPYDQHLQQCHLKTQTTGLFVAVSADSQATTATLKVLNEDDSDHACQTVTLEVPDRVFIANTILAPISSTGKGVFLLEIDAPPDVDLSAVRAADISFPEGNGPSLTLLLAQDLNHISSGGLPLDRPFECDASGIKALVRVDGAQAYPAKIVINNVKSGGTLQEGIAYATLPTPAWESSMADAEAKYIDVDSIRTRYFEKGEGEAFLLVHGGQAGSSGFSALSWIQIFDGLADHFHVYALDRIGQGYTDNPKTDQEYESYYERVVDHVLGFIKEMDIDRVHLMGHSQGGWPVTRLALDHPELVRSVVIVDSSVAAPADGTKKTENFYGFISRFIHPPEGPTEESLRRDQGIFSYTLNNITDNLITRIHEISQTEKMKEAHRQFGKHRMSPAHPSFRQLKDSMVEDIKAGKFKVPTLIVWGFNDPEGSYHAGLKLFEFLSANSSRVQFHAFNKSGHMPCIEYPEEFNGQVISFVTSLDA